MIDCIENILCPRADYGWDHFNDSFTDSEMNYALDNRCCLLDFLCEGVSALVNLAIFICRAVVLVFMCLAAAVITGVEYLLSRLINSFWIWNYLFPPEEVFPIETLEGKEERLGERDQLSRRVPQELIGCILEYAGVKGYQTLACVNRRLYYRVNEEALMLGFDRRYYGMCNEVSHLVLQTQALRLGGGQLRRDCQNGL